MYYISTADRLTRTATWLQELEGGLEQLKEIVVHDKLGICDELERQMQHLVDTYKCEWKEVVDDPLKRRLFRQFVNSDETESGIEIIHEREQRRPVDWPKGGVSARSSSLVQIDGLASTKGNGQAAPNTHGHPRGTTRSATARSTTDWVNVGQVADFPAEGGAAVKYGDVQIAVYNFSSRGQWYACQNMCPHMNAFVLSRGIIGSVGTVPKVACPLHKKSFSLQTGQNLTGEDLALKVFAVKIEDDAVYLELPPQDQLNALLATSAHRCAARPGVPMSETG
jgi:nitrite reductase (NADH) large subunit